MITPSVNVTAIVLSLLTKRLQSREGRRPQNRSMANQEDTAGLFKRLTFAGVAIVTSAEGDITFLRIFRDYVAGTSPKQICKALNKEGTPGPQGALWSPNTIHGNPKRGIGILHNELYVGRLVWNRQRFLKDPDTGKRVARPNPKSAWIVKEVPEVRIVDDETWKAVRSVRVGPEEMVDGSQGRSIPAVPATEVPVLGADEVRPVRRRLHRPLARVARMLRSARSRHLHEHASDLAPRRRSPRPERATDEAAAEGFL